MKHKFSVPVPTGSSMLRWAADVHNYLRDTTSGAVDPETILMQHQIGGEKATVDGLLMWDTDGYPVVSKGGEWRQILLQDGYAVLTQNNDITAAAVNTAYAVQYDAPAFADGISLSGTNPTRIVFAEAGLYRIGFTAQISSSSSSTANFRFWPRINGADITGSTMVASLHSNGSTTVVSRDGIFQIAANGYLEVMWAVDVLTGYLQAHAATAYAPAAPSTTLTIARVQQ